MKNFIDDSGDHFPRRSLGVGVLDPQDERSPVPSRVEPIEERRTRTADVQITGGRRGEADAKHPSIVPGAVPYGCAPRLRLEREKLELKMKTGNQKLETRNRLPFFLRL